MNNKSNQCFIEIFSFFWEGLSWILKLKHKKWTFLRKTFQKTFVHFDQLYFIIYKKKILSQIVLPLFSDPLFWNISLLWSKLLRCSLMWSMMISTLDFLSNKSFLAPKMTLKYIPEEKQSNYKVLLSPQNIIFWIFWKFYKNSFYQNWSKVL